MDLEHLNILKLELHETKSDAHKAGASLACRNMYIEALEMAIFQLESIKDLEQKLADCLEARKMDAELIKSWQTEDRVKGCRIEDLQKEVRALTTELGNLVPAAARAKGCGIKP